MKKEIELKFRVKDFAPIRKKLKSLGAKLVWKGREKNWFFDTKDRIFLKNDSGLRLKVSDRARLNLKEGKHIERGVKIAYENEAEVDNPVVIRYILEKLGCKIYFQYSKHREHWNLWNGHVELDTVRGMKFVEVEASHKNIRKIARLLNLDFARTTTKSYTQILRAWK